MVGIDQIRKGALTFVEKEIIGKATGATKFAIYFAMPIIDNKITNYINSVSETKELFDENKNLDLDKAYNYAKHAIQKSGQFMYYGILFCESDVDKLYAYIRGDLV